MDRLSSAIRKSFSPAAIAACLIFFLLVGLSSSALAVRVKWTKTYNGADNSSDNGNGVAVGPDGSVYVTGRTLVIGQAANIWVRKYSPKGKVKWTKTYNGADNSADQGRGVAVGPDGSIYVTGHTAVIDQETNIWVRKYR